LEESDSRGMDNFDPTTAIIKYPYKHIPASLLTDKQPDWMDEDRRRDLAAFKILD
jgi:hypothetical protein